MGVRSKMEMDLRERATTAIEQHCTKDCIHEWYRKLGRCDAEAIRELEHRKLASGNDVRHSGMKMTGEICLHGKTSRLPFSKASKSKSSAILHLVNSDLCEPMDIAWYTRGFTQRTGLEYDEIFAPEAKLATLTMLVRHMETAFIENVKKQYT